VWWLLLKVHYLSISRFPQQHKAFFAKVKGDSNLLETLKGVKPSPQTLTQIDLNSAMVADAYHYQNAPGAIERS
jgi:hypothetical protein